MKTTIWAYCTSVALAVGIHGGAQAQTAIVLDQTGAVAETDPRDGEAGPYDEYVINLPAVTQVRITATRAGEFDPNLTLLSPAGQQISYNDDGAGDLNALLQFTTTTAGAYRVRVRGLGGSTGSYRIVAENMGPGVAPPPPRRIVGDQSGRFVQGTSPSTGENSYYTDYRIRLNAGQEIVLNLDSDDFDAYLLVLNSDATGDPLASNDDSSNGRNSTLVFRAPTAGNYIIRASQLGTSEGGYRLRVRRITAW